MTKFKQVALALATAGLLATQAHAGEAQAPALHHAPLTTFSQQDIGSLFDQAGQPMQLAALSDVEMRETEGAWWFAPVAVWSIGGGALGVATNRWQTGSWAGSGRAFGAGATAGFWSSPITRGFSAPVRFAGGTVGSASWYRR